MQLITAGVGNGREGLSGWVLLALRQEWGKEPFTRKAGSG